MNTYTILILLIAWATPGLVAVMPRMRDPFQKRIEATGSFLMLLSLIGFLIWPGEISQEGLKGLAAILIYPVMIGYAFLGYRSVVEPKYEKKTSGSWSTLVLFILAGILGVLFGEYLPIILISWLLIVFFLYKLITYQDVDLESGQDYRERLNKDYLDRF